MPRGGRNEDWWKHRVGCSYAIHVVTAETAKKIQMCKLKNSIFAVIHSKTNQILFCKTVCTQNFVQKQWEIHLPSCCCMCATEWNIQRKTFAADMLFLHCTGGCTSRVLFGCVLGATYQIVSINDMFNRCRRKRKKRF